MAAETQTPDLTNASSNATFVDSLLGIAEEIYTSPINLILLSASLFLLYRIYQDKQAQRNATPPKPPLGKMAKRDFTLEELRVYDGGPNAPEGRILMACNGRVFDVTRGKMFYGPGGPYGVFAGRDASRGLGSRVADESMIRETHDDLVDLTPDQWSTLKEWEERFEGKYHQVGRLLKPGETHTDYAAEEAAKTQNPAEAETKVSSSTAAQ